MHIKKYTQKDRYGNMMSFEFETPEINIPPMQEIPHPGEPKGTDTVPAWLTPGEFVVNKEATQMYGNLIEDINNQGRAVQAMKGMEVPLYAQVGRRIPDTSWITPEILSGIKETESGGRHTDSKGELIKSSAGALGAYQWKPESAAKPGYGVKPFDITSEAAQRKATEEYLKGIQIANPDFTKEQVLQAYNAGPTRMRQYVSNLGVPDQISGQKPLAKETQEYDDKVLKAAGLNVPSSNDIPVVVPGFEGQDPKKMSPIRLEAYNKALAKMKNKGMPIETEVTKNRKDIDYSDPSLKVPELDGIAEDPSDSTTVDYTKDVPISEKVFPGFVDKTFPDRGQGTPPTKADDAKRVAAMKYGADVKVDFKGRPEKVNPNRIDPKVLDNAAKANIEGNLSDEAYENIKKDFEQAVNQDKAAKQYEVESTEGKKVANEEALANTIDGLIKQLGDDEVKNNAIMNKIETLEENAYKSETKATDSEIKEEKKKSAIDEIIKKTEETPNITKDKKEITPAEADDAGKNADKDTLKKSEGFFMELFGDLFDKKELARMAVMYAGSRALGSSHQGALGFAAKQYVTRVDAKAAAADKFAKANVGKYTTDSLELYKKSKDLRDLVSITAPIKRLAEFETFYGRLPNGKTFQIRAEKVQQGDNKYYVGPDGKRIDPRKYNVDPAYVKDTKEYRDLVSKQSKVYIDQLKALKKVTGKDSDQKNVYATDIIPASAGPKIAEWAIANGVSVEKVGGLVDLAMKDAINDVRQDKSRVQDLTPYLNSLIIREQTTVPDLFINPETKKPVDARKFETLNNNIEFVMRKIGGSGTKFNLTNQYYNELLKDWNNLDDKAKEQYNKKAGKNRLRFYVIC